MWLRDVRTEFPAITVRGKRIATEMVARRMTMNTSTQTKIDAGHHALDALKNPPLKMLIDHHANDSRLFADRCAYRKLRTHRKV